jgi:hypothetical protein
MSTVVGAADAADARTVTNPRGARCSGHHVARTERPSPSCPSDSTPRTPMRSKKKASARIAPSSQIHCRQACDAGDIGTLHRCESAATVNMRAPRVTQSPNAHCGCTPTACAVQLQHSSRIGSRVHNSADC